MMLIVANFSSTVMTDNYHNDDDATNCLGTAMADNDDDDDLS